MKQIDQEIGAATSPQVLRRVNARRVLEHAWRTGAFTASDAMAATGLTRSTVIGVCDELLRQGWLEELQDARAVGAYTKGRPARRYALRERAAVVVGVDAGYDHVSAAVADLRGTILGTHGAVIPAPGPEHIERLADAEQRRTLARAAVAGALQDANADGSEVLAITVAVPAPADRDGASPAEDWFWSLTNPGYADLFEASAELVTVENDANLAAIAERSVAAGGGRDVDSFIALIVGEGLGAGLMLDGRLVRGRRGGAGELRFLDRVEGVGSADGVALLARRWAVEAIRAGLPSDSALGLLDPLDLDEGAVGDAALAGDPAAIDIIDRLAARLARICLLLGDLLDVDRVVVSGAAAASLPMVITRAAAILDESGDPTAPELRRSELGDRCVTLGAIEHALGQVRERALDLTPTVRGAA
ncbi:putative NBD/HSP70 family sugar kinase [Agromyces flavus]|uniref:NBD/HSP70 family sugar kinase n=1 Tax=Agromyces flavus TaxID=589382 RepID=A0A1H1VSV9_9MICO|nr:ROK family protein [Agromyces flavus]MCP2366006.1 putative NBD/HSP70 family sugar kinase [Agromyces flavus]GGI43811.1 transcriptional regulator [Agromyces flavus]SDS87987.1 Sugar kinase of the NBD/HSP70 family, may contain an N-terminal HTH domain [Agromyces flavus]